MKASHFYLILSAIIITPHMSFEIAIGGAVFFYIVALVARIKGE